MIELKLKIENEIKVLNWAIDATEKELDRLDLEFEKRYKERTIYKNLTEIRDEYLITLKHIKQFERGLL